MYASGVECFKALLSMDCAVVISCRVLDKVADGLNTRRAARN